MALPVLRMRTVIGSERIVAVVALLVTGIFFYSGAVSSAVTSGQPGLCTNSVSVTIGPQVSPATEELAFTLKLTNTRARSCVIDAYPTLVFTNAKHQIVAFKYSHKATGGYEMTKALPKRVVIEPHKSAYLLVAKSTCVGPDRERAASVSISVPWPASSANPPFPGYKTVLLKYPKTPGFTTCAGANAAVDNTIAFSPVEPSFAATL